MSMTPGDTAATPQVEATLSRDLGLTSALAIGVGTMIAAGIFTLSGLAVRNVGSSAIIAFLLAAAVAAITALTYCEFASLYPEPGEGYLYARRTFRPLSAYFVGWALFLGYTSSCAFYISSLSSYFQEFIFELPYHAASGAAAVLALTLLNIKGTKESGRFQVIVTIAKVVLLVWFVAGGLRTAGVEGVLDEMSSDFAGIASTAAMVFVTFFGFSAIAASAGEVRNPVKTIPRAIFISMGVVTVLYTLVVLVVVAAGLTEYDEAAMGSAAKQFLGPIGGMVIIAAALFSMVSASNASIMAGSRVILSMAWHGHLPRGLGSISPQTRTPAVALLAVGGTILLFALALPLEDLAHFADVVLLLALIMVNIALIVHRRRYPDLQRPFRVPLVPVLPAVGIVANVYLLSQIAHHATPLAMAATCLLFGVAGFVAWKGYRALEPVTGQPPRVALERAAAVGSDTFRVLTPLAHPGHIKPLMDYASAIAADRDGEVIALRVLLVPEQLPPDRQEAQVQRESDLVEMARVAGVGHGVPTTALVCIGHDVARAVVQTARRRACNLIVIGWKGYTTTTRRILGEVVDDVADHAACDIMLVKQVAEAMPQKILLPSAGGEHARQAETYVASLLRQRGGEVTVCQVAPPDADDAAVARLEQRLEQARQRLMTEPGLTVHKRVIRHTSVSAGIIEATREYDAVVVGAAGRSHYPRILFGSIPETIAKHALCTVILVKRHHPVKALVGRIVGD